MTVQDLGSVGEFVAALATLVTLVYLALQIRANTRVMQAESDRGLVNIANVLATAIGSNREAASIFRRGLSDHESLDPDEQVQFAFLFTPLVNQASSACQDFHLGITDQKRFETAAAAAIGMLKTPGGRTWWKLYSQTHSPEFKVYVEAQLHQN